MQVVDMINKRLSVLEYHSLRPDYILIPAGLMGRFREESNMKEIDHHQGQVFTEYLGMMVLTTTDKKVAFAFKDSRKYIQLDHLEESGKLQVNKHYKSK